MLIRHLFRLPWIALVLLLMQSPVHAANNPAVVLRDIHAAQMILQVVASSFHRYQGAEGDNKQLAVLNADLGVLKETLRTVFQDLGDMGMNAELDQLKIHWSEAARNLNTAVSAISGGGFAEGQIVNDYLLNNLKAATDLDNAYAAVLKTTGYKIAPELQALRNQTVLMQKMSTLYMEQSSSQYAYTYRQEQGNEETLDQMATRFTRGLDQIQVSGDNVKRLTDVRSKWKFLEKSFMNYNENSVPYLVLKFGPAIITGLQEMAASIDKD